ncbi:hypothetical protein FRB99_000878 [Tulasnella sp. 403]|nr:hypothetical protein FRB99_000878 [Tulasnella sp. 403]
MGDESEAAPKPLTLKIRIPAFKRAPQPPPPPKSPSPVEEPEDDEQGLDEQPSDDDDEQSHSPISMNDANEPVQPPNPWTLAVQAPALPTKIKLKKKPKPRPKLFGRVTAPLPKSLGLPLPYKKPPRLKSLAELLPRIIARIKKKDHYGIFLQPVDTTAFPLYLTVIKFPMDLSTMSTKVDQGKYRSLEQFSADFRLMIENCKTFNPPPSLYYTEAVKLELFGNEVISQAAGQLAEPQSPVEGEDAAQEIRMDIDEGITMSTPAQPTPGLSTGTSTSFRHVRNSSMRNRSESVAAVAGATPQAGGSYDGYRYHPPAPSVQKTWIRGPYRKTVAREVPLIGPEGELPGKRYRTKKEKLEMERRGAPTLWDGSIDYAQLEDPFGVLHNFVPEPFDSPWLSALKQPPDTDALDPSFPVSTTAEHLARRTEEILGQAKNHPPAFFVQHGPVATRRHAIEDEPLDEYELPKRLASAYDFGSYSLVGEVDSRRLAEEEVTTLEGAPVEGDWTKEGGVDSAEYIRDVVYGGMDGLAYVRSVMDFVRGMKLEGLYDNPDVKADQAPGFDTWVEDNVLSMATGNLHNVLAETARYLTNSDSTPSPSIVSCVDRSLHTHPLLRQRISQLAKLEEEDLRLSSLVEDQTEPMEEKSTQRPDVIADAGPTSRFSPEWAEKALALTAQQIDSLVESKSSAPEPETLRELRRNLLALAEFAPSMGSDIMKAFSRTKPATVKRVFSRQASTSPKVVLGVRKEDPGRLWERRCPVTPDAVNDLVREGVEVLIQPCERRVWPNEEFVKAGATIHPTLSPANIVIGIKETPLSELDRLVSPVEGRERTHIMFSHTAKGQLYNMPLLSRFVEGSASRTKDLPRLVDYELLTGTDGKRVVGFGWFAGAAGLVEGLSASAHDFLSLGVSSPFLYLPRPYSHPSLADMRRSLRSVGEIIATRGMPKSTGPFVIAVTGNGNVATGALDLLSELPTCFVKAEELPVLVSNPDTDLRKVYVIHVPSSAYLTNTKTGGPFDRADYYANPNDYESHFHEKIAPYVTVLINGAGWSLGYPRILPNSVLPKTIQLARSVGKSRFRTIADISCDISGGIEFVNRSCTIDDPFFYCDSQGRELSASAAFVQGGVADGVQVMSIDILPSELPLDASKHFSKALKPYLGALLRMYQGKTTTEGDAAALDVVNRATIARGGQLLPRHQWLGELVMKTMTQQHEGIAASASDAAITSDTDKVDLDLGTDLGGLDTSMNGAGYGKKRKVLLLGSGMVAKPAVEEFLSRRDVEVVVASNNLAEAKELTMAHERASAVYLDASNQAAINNLVQNADIIVSLLPAPLHPPVAKLCIQNRKHLITASYISHAMRSLHNEAQAADVLLLNEIGLDPGIDHCSAMDLRHRIESEGRRIVSFVSWCGGLPAPEDSNVPLGMKFSWSPRGLLSAALNDARFKLNGQAKTIKGHDLLSSHFASVPLVRGLALEGLANRDSLPYAGKSIPVLLHSLHALGSNPLHRYKGFSKALDILREIGLLDATPVQTFDLNPGRGGWHSLVAMALERRLGEGQTFKDTKGTLSAVVGKERAEEVWPLLEELSMVPPSTSSGTTPDLPSLPNTTSPTSFLDMLTTLLAHKLCYNRGEKDMVILSHNLISVPKSHPPLSASDTAPTPYPMARMHTSTLITYGTPSSLGASAMSRTVGLPLAVAALKVLDGAVVERGVTGPGECGSAIWKGVMDGLEERGIAMRENEVSGVVVGGPNSL